MPYTIFKKIYYAFFHDTVRLYKVMPSYFKRRFWLIFLLQIIVALVEASTILMITFFAISMASPDIVINHAITKKIFLLFPKLADLVIDKRLVGLFICFFVVVFIFFKNIMVTFTTLKSAHFSEDISAYIGEETFRRYLNKNYLWHISPISNLIFQKFNHRSSLSLLLINLLQLYSNIICSLVMFSSLFIAQPDITLIVITVFSLVGLGVYFGIRKKMDRDGRRITQASIMETTASMTAVRGIREVLIYRQQPVFLEQIVKGMRAGIAPRSSRGLAGIVPSSSLETAGFVTIFGVLSYMVLQGRTMPEIIAASSMLMLTAWRVLPSVSRSLGASVMIRSLRPQAEICLELLETFIAEDVPPLPDPDPNFNFSQSLSLKNVNFRYPANDTDSLTDISLEIAKGSSIGIIGVSGAGKSTLAGVLSGLLPPRDGEIAVDNLPLTPPRLAAYCQKVGFVPQTPFMLAGTIGKNVAFSKWGQEYDREQVKNACEKAAMEFVFSHPRGIDMPVSEGGGGLSGGQAQRVSIARALFIEPDVIVFDEATSALDQASENIIKDTIRCLQGQVTTIIIAHRLSTIESCDSLIWLENGRIRKMGPPAELLPLYEESMRQPTTVAVS